MAVTIYDNVSDLVTDLVNKIGPNGTQAITGQVHQDAMLTAVLSLVNIMASLPGSTVSSFPIWDAAATYVGGSEVVVRHANKLWLFVSGSDSLGVQPGTDAGVWVEISAVALAHFRNRDQYLDFGGASQVSAQELRTHLDGMAETRWLRPVDNVLPAPEGTEEVGARLLVDIDAFDDFEGHDHKVATKVPGGWSFTDTTVGDAIRIKAQPQWVLLRSEASWVQYDMQAMASPKSLAQVMLVGNNTGTSTLVLSRALSRGFNEISHLSAGALNLPLSAAGAWRIIVGANITLSFGVVAGQNEYFIRLVGGTGTNTITWAGDKWRRPDGVALPTEISSGERYDMLVAGDGDRLNILFVTKAIDV